MSKTYKITDGNAIETAATLTEAADIAAEWYVFLADEGKVETVPDADLDASSLKALNASIGRWEAKIAEAAGSEDFAGHGNYHVSAADRMGLRLVVREEVEEVDYSEYTVRVSNDPCYYGPDCTMADAERITGQIADIIRSEFPGITVEVFNEIGSSATTGPDSDVVEEINVWIQENWTTAL